MNSHQQSLLVNDLTYACETGDAEEIMKVMDENFWHLQTARSFFSVTDERYEKSFLPESRDFLGKGYLHSFLASRRLLPAKNRGEGDDFKFTFAIALDTQFPSFLRSRYQGVSISGQDEALTECLRFVASYRSGMGMEPYLFENSERVDDPKVRETLEAYLQFMKAPAESLCKGHIEATLTGAELNRKLDQILSMLNGSDWQAYALPGKRYWAISYIALLVAASIHLTSRNSSASFRLGRLLDELDQLFAFPKLEIHLIHAFFERGNQERFFRQVQSNGRDLAKKLKNMAWDLSYPRTIFQNVSALARTNPDHADFVAPFFLTFDQPLRELLAGYQANGHMTYLDEGGVKNIVIYPLEVEAALSEGFEASQHLLTPERTAARMQRGREFNENEERQLECIAYAERLLKEAFLG